LNKTRISMRNFTLQDFIPIKSFGIRAIYTMAMLFMIHVANTQTITTSKIECACLSNETTSGNGQFSEILRVTGPTAATWTVVSSTGLYATSSAAPPALPTPLANGTVVPETGAGTGIYELGAKRVDNTTWTATLSNGTRTVTINSSQVCKYPRKDIIGDDGACINSEDKTYRLNIPPSLLATSVWSVSGGGVAAGPSGTNPFKVNWGTTVGTYTVSVSGTARAYSGQTANFCSFSSTKQVTIANEPTVSLVCNNQVNVSMNGNCDLNIGPDLVLENMAFPNTSYNVVIKDMQADTLIPYTRLSQKYLNKNLQVSVVHECSGNSCWGYIRLEDKSIPELICNDITIECTESLIPSLPRHFPVNPDAVITAQGGTKFLVKNFDYCSDVTLVYNDRPLSTDCGAEFSKVIERTWLATDISGNTATCSAEIYVKKGVTTDVKFPPNWDSNLKLLNPTRDMETIEACSSYPRKKPGSNIPHHSYTGEPTGTFCQNVDVTFHDDSINICGHQSFKIIRTWILTDRCNGVKPITHTQVITVMDNFPPAVIAPRDTIIGTDGFTCGNSFNVAPPRVRNECSTWDYTVTIKVPDASGKPAEFSTSEGVVRNANGTYTITRFPTGVTTLWVVYTVKDACGWSTDAFTEVTIKDSTKPVAVCDQFTFVGLNTDGEGLLTAEAVDDGSWDNCSIDSFSIKRMNPGMCGKADTTWAKKILFCCKDIGNAVMVQMRVTDKAGNTNVCMVEVRTQDNIPPRLHNCPADRTVDCSADLINLTQYGVPTTTDVCGATLTERVKSKSLNECGTGTLVRVFTAQDKHGNRDSCMQTIKIVALTPFTRANITWPADHIVPNGCLGTAIEPKNLPAGKQNPTWTAVSCSNVSFEHEDLVFQYVDGYCFKVLRKWTVIDWCQFDPLDINKGRFVHTQVIKVQNNQAPNITKGCKISDYKLTNVDECKILVELTATATDDCTKPENLIWSYTIDINNNGTVDFSANSNALSRVLPFGKHKITWNSTDECGNSGKCDVLLEVKDTKAPTPYCLTDITTVIMGQGGKVVIWASDFNKGSFDNCSPADSLRYAFSTNPAHISRTYTCDSLTSRNTRFNVRMYVIDKAGNYDFCQTSITVQDNSNVCNKPNVSGTTVAVVGTVATENSKSLEGVNLQITSNQVEFPKYTKTNALGEFEFRELGMYNDYMITPNKDENHTLGISTLDLVLIQRHILGLKKLDNPYKLIAADINNDQKINASDLVVLRKLILGLYDKLPSAPSYKFVDKTYTFSDPSHPWPFKHEAGMANLDHDAMNTDFIAIKTGDINDTYANLRNEEASPRGKTILYYDTKNVDGYTEISFSNSASNILGGQLALNFNSQDYEYAGLASQVLDLDETNVLANGNNINVSWNSEVTSTTSETLFTIRLKQKSKNNLDLALDGNVLTPELYTSGSESIAIHPLSLEPRAAAGQGLSFELHQNTPNPFKNTTTIAFNLPEAGEATLKIFDYSGVELKRIQKSFEKGYNTVEVNTEEINKTGILFYQLDTKTHSATKKMIVIK
jgi:hypothetical protein